MRFLSDIVQYSYSPEELKKCVRTADFWKFNITKTQFNQQIVAHSDTFLSSDCQITKINASSLGKNRIFHPASIQDALCLRRTNNIIKRAIRASSLNRDHEVKQLLHILRGESKCRILRTDIEAYFESIPFARIISQLEEDGFRNNCALSHLKHLNAILIRDYGLSGLPRGLALSSTIAHYTLQPFDQKLLNNDAVIYYTRYVDDICIVHVDDPQSIQTSIQEALPRGLKLNKSKTQALELPSANTLHFLGYSIWLERPHKVSIADNKLAKAKKRIVLSLKGFLRDKDFKLLLDRLRFLSCSTRMDKVGRKVPVCTGYRHVYRRCDDETASEQLKSLDSFLHGILNSKRYSLGRALRQLLTTEQAQLLRTPSFQKHYAGRLTFKVEPRRLSAIKRAWKYE